jgi:DNA polymerase-3 subunit epsilon
MKWQESTLLAIDTETTGLDPEKDRIVELGACLFEPDDEVKSTIKGQWTRFGTLIDPGIPIPQEASEIHGITDELVKGHPCSEEIAANFLCRVVEADVLVGYNWPFDAGMLRAAFGSSWDIATNGKPILDALVLVRIVGRFWPGKGRHKLDAVARRLKIARQGRAHRASSDAELAIRILQRFADKLPEDAHEASEYLARKRVEQDEDFKAWLATQEGANATNEDNNST